MAEREKLIELKDLQITFGTGRKKFVAVDHVNFDIYKGETFSLVGESGSGKTTIGRAITRINPVSAGEIYFKGQRISGKISKEMDLEVIKKCQMIFQDPMASLNERAKVDYIVSEGLINHHLYKDEDDRKRKVEYALREVGLLPEFASRFPHEFSGGQRQRIGIARALIMEPEVLFLHPLHPRLQHRQARLGGDPAGSLHLWQQEGAGAVPPGDRGPDCDSVRLHRVPLQVLQSRPHSHWGGPGGERRGAAGPAERSHRRVCAPAAGGSQGQATAL